MNELTKQQGEEAIDAVASAMELLSARYDTSVLLAVTAAITAATAGQHLALNGATREQAEESAAGLARSFQETCMKGFDDYAAEVAKNELG